jgi:hypothetical protein
MPNPDYRLEPIVERPQVNKSQLPHGLVRPFTSADQTLDHTAQTVSQGVYNQINLHTGGRVQSAKPNARPLSSKPKVMKQANSNVRLEPTGSIFEQE